jgi:hypothetical protein
MEYSKCCNSEIIWLERAKEDMAGDACSKCYYFLNEKGEREYLGIPGQ